MEETRNARKVSVGKPDGRRPLEKHGYRWNDNKTCLYEIICKSLN